MLLDVVHKEQLRALRQHFRVVWARRVGAGEYQAGLEAVKRGNNMWDVELEDEVSADVLAK